MDRYAFPHDLLRAQTAWYVTHERLATGPSTAARTSSAPGGVVPAHRRSPVLADQGRDSRSADGAQGTAPGRASCCSRSSPRWRRPSVRTSGRASRPSARAAGSWSRDRRELPRTTGAGVLGSVADGQLPSLAQVNRFPTDVDPGWRPATGLVVGHDIVGGVFALNGGDPAAAGHPGAPGQMTYFAPDTLEWEAMEMGHSGWVSWLLPGRQRTRWAGEHPTA
ncbi:DUF2625 family protein [Streptomyces sp. NPDC056240]|uniref:DUF2625 family protein n=1 Tax=Streptomyces sp. NPDC056240 TaxID=3345759 RepID=UPI0035E05C6E